MACYQVTLDIEDLYRTGFSIALAIHSLDLRWSAEFGPIAFYQHIDPLDRKPGLYVVIRVTC